MTEKYISSEVEQDKIEVKTISEQYLLNRVFPRESLSRLNLLHQVYKGELPQDKRFLKLYEGGIFECFDPECLIRNVDISFYPVVEMDGKIVALSRLHKDPHKKNNL